MNKKIEIGDWVVGEYNGEQVYGKVVDLYQYQRHSYSKVVVAVALQGYCEGTSHWFQEGELEILDKEALIHTGYEFWDDVESIMSQIDEYPCPYKTDLEGKIRWVEFIRALLDGYSPRGDFSILDEFSLNGIPFTAGTAEEIREVLCGD